MITMDPRYIANELPSYWMGTLIHEQFHAWCCYLRAPKPLDRFALLSPNRAHWSPLLILPAGYLPFMGGSQWAGGIGGLYSRSCPYVRAVRPGTWIFTKLDLYLMGLAPPEEVPPVELLTKTDAQVKDYACEPMTARDRVTLRIDDLIAANGIVTSAVGYERPSFVDGGYHSRWLAQSAGPTLHPGQTAWAWVSFVNVGIESWVRGTSTEARLGVAGDGRTPFDRGMAVGWPLPERVAVQGEPEVGPGRVGTFTFKVRAPRAPGEYRIDLRLVIDGITWFEDQGVFITVTVK